MLETLHLIERIHEAIGEAFMVLLVLTCMTMPGAVLLAVVRGHSAVRCCCAQIAITFSVAMFVAYFGSSEPTISHGPYFQPVQHLAALGLIIGFALALLPKWQLITPFNVKTILSEMKSSWRLSAISAVIAVGLIIVLMQFPIWHCIYYGEYLCFTYGY